ncbi:Rhs element Vgr protein, partial [Pseudomonas aeruginosa]|uniref:Rhs element Vgr protein n=1 Tax=Pseudomonas aeruginosa TaxID=287 RepID=UPI003CC63289
LLAHQTPLSRRGFSPKSVSGISRPLHFQLIDHETGKPVAGRRVRVWSSGGWNAFDTTDADGMTSWIERPTAETLYIDLVKRGDA